MPNLNLYHPSIAIPPALAMASLDALSNSSSQWLNMTELVENQFICRHGMHAFRFPNPSIF